MPTVLKQVVRAFDNITPLRAPNFSPNEGSSSAAPAPIRGTSAEQDDSPTDPGTPQTRSPSPSSTLAKRYATATRDSLIGTTYEHIASASLATSSDLQPPITIQPEHPIQKPDFTVLQAEPNYAMLTQPQLIELARRLHLELNISRLHAGEMESTIQIYQAGLVLSGAHSRKQQKQLHGHEEKAKKKKDNMPIKIDLSKGRIISSEEAKQYELARIQQLYHSVSPVDYN